jgi:hypothetical protein
MKKEPARTYRFYDFIMAAFVAALLCSNIIGAGKVANVFGATLGAGIFFFPVTYLFGDILTEVYGYARSRRVIWAGFGALIFASGMSWFVLALPPAPGWPHQGAYELVLGSTPRITMASLTAFFVGEFCNSYVLAKLKVITGGRLLWMRAILSTVVGEAVDTLIFYPLAFGGSWKGDLLLKVMVTNYAIKVLWEVVAMPITYRAVSFLKRAEHEDFYDTKTNFTPFSLKT